MDSIAAIFAVDRDAKTAFTIQKRDDGGKGLIYSAVPK